MASLAKIASYERRYVEAGGIKTHYIEEGRGEPIILIHGGGPGADGCGNWCLSLPLFAKRFRAIAVDMVGFGKTDKPDPANFSYSQQARNDHIISFIQGLGLPKANLIGNSMGGATSIGVAMKRPDLVNKMVLMGSAGIKTTEVPKALTPLMQYDGTAEGMRAVIKALTGPGYQMDEELLRYRVELSNSPGAVQGLRATMAWVREQHGLYYEDEELRKVKTPALVVVGKDDPICDLKQAYRLLELLDNSWGYQIPHAGHWVMMERPIEFATVCTNFLVQ